MICSHRQADALDQPLRSMSYRSESDGSTCTMTTNKDFLNVFWNSDIKWNALSAFSEYKSSDKPSPKPAYRSFSLHHKKQTWSRTMERPRMWNVVEEGMHKQPHQVCLLFTCETHEFSQPNILETFKLRRIIMRDILYFQSKKISWSGVMQVTMREFKMLYFQNQKH